jgi:hypothetical protein
MTARTTAVLGQVFIMAREQREVHRDLKEGLEKLASQQDKASLGTYARAGGGRKPGALRTAIKSLEVDVAAIKLAVPAFADDEGRQAVQRPGASTGSPTHSVAAAAAGMQNGGGSAESSLARLWAGPTGLVPVLPQERRRPPMYAAYAAYNPAPDSLVNLHNISAPSSTPASPAEPAMAASPGPGQAEPFPPSTSATLSPSEQAPPSVLPAARMPGFGSHVLPDRTAEPLPFWFHFALHHHCTHCRAFWCSCRRNPTLGKQRSIYCLLLCLLTTGLGM